MLRLILPLLRRRWPLRYAPHTTLALRYHAVITGIATHISAIYILLTPVSCHGRRQVMNIREARTAITPLAGHTLLIRRHVTPPRHASRAPKATRQPRHI